MRYRLHLSAWDVMDQVHIRMSVFDDAEDPSGQDYRVIEFATTLRGEGEDDPWQWVRDALVAAIEQV